MYLPQRPPTPQILHDPIVDEENEDQYGWYYDEDAGGHVLDFGKFKGRRIHATSLSYLYWCKRKFKRTARFIDFLDAFDRFHDGLEKYAETNYGEFIVPFGRKHRGKTIQQCRDKPWLTWIDRNLSRMRVMSRKYGVFFKAVKQWLAHPRHQETHRDIGELLAATEYEDDLDLKREYEEDYDDEPTESDREFIVSDDEEILVEGSSDGERSTNVAEGSDGGSSDATDDSEATSASSAPESDTPITELKTRSRRKRSSRPAKDNFIENDEEEDGSAEYTPPQTPEPESPVETSTRTLRSSTRKKGRANRDGPPHSPSPTPARPRKRNTARSRSSTLVPSSNSPGGDDDPREEIFQSLMKEVALSAKKKATSTRRAAASPSPTPARRHVRDRDHRESSPNGSDAHSGESPRKLRRIIKTPPRSKGKNREEGNSLERGRARRSQTPITPSRMKAGRRLYKVVGDSDVEVSPIIQSPVKGPTAPPKANNEAATQTRVVADYFAHFDPFRKLPPRVQDALDTLVSYVHEQQTVIDTETIASDGSSDIQMLS